MRGGGTHVQNAGSVKFVPLSAYNRDEDGQVRQVYEYSPNPPIELGTTYD